MPSTLSDGTTALAILFTPSTPGARNMLVTTPPAMHSVT
jgi:hypothetical protein